MLTKIKITFDLEAVTDGLTSEEVSAIVLKKLDFSQYMFQENLHGKDVNILILSKKANVQIL
jgi:hypothetical protein